MTRHYCPTAGIFAPVVYVARYGGSQSAQTLPHISKQACFCPSTICPARLVSLSRRSRVLIATSVVPRRGTVLARICIAVASALRTRRKSPRRHVFPSSILRSLNARCIRLRHTRLVWHVRLLLDLLVRVVDW